jgi:hypothetical protein
MKEGADREVRPGERGVKSKRAEVIALRSKELPELGGPETTGQTRNVSLRPKEIEELKELARRKRIILDYETADRTNHTHEMLCRLTQIPAYTMRIVDQ